MARLRLVLMALLAGAASLAAGLAVYWLTAMMPCSGEGLACNIDTAITKRGDFETTPSKAVHNCLIETTPNKLFT